MKCISFDFDDTLASKSIAKSGERVFSPIEPFVQLLKEYHALGCRCIILTARYPTTFNKTEIIWFLKRNNIEQCVEDIVFTSHVPKGKYAVEQQVCLHYEDMESHIESVRSFGIKVISSKI